MCVWSLQKYWSICRKESRTPHHIAEAFLQEAGLQTVKLPTNFNFTVWQRQTSFDKHHNIFNGCKATGGAAARGSIIINFSFYFRRRLDLVSNDKRKKILWLVTLCSNGIWFNTLATVIAAPEDPVFERTYFCGKAYTEFCWLQSFPDFPLQEGNLKVG